MKNAPDVDPIRDAFDYTGTEGCPGKGIPLKKAPPAHETVPAGFLKPTHMKASPRLARAGRAYHTPGHHMGFELPWLRIEDEILSYSWSGDARERMPALHTRDYVLRNKGLQN